MTTFQAALLDLDGTLLDSIPDLAHAANAMRIELGMPALHIDVVATFVGKGVDNLVRRALAGSLHAPDPEPEAFELARASFYRHYHLVNGDKATVFEGVIEGLKAMRDQGLKLAVVTNKPTEFTLPLLERTGLSGFFQEVVCGDTCVRRKPDPDQMFYACERLGVTPAQTVAIGDSVNDALAARAAGMRVLAVPYGYNEGQDVQGLDVDAIVGSIALAAEWIAEQNAAQTPTLQQA
jgi:phosphoglycolate phosphatase